MAGMTYEEAAKVANALKEFGSSPFLVKLGELLEMADSKQLAMIENGTIDEYITEYRDLAKKYETRQAKRLEIKSEQSESIRERREAENIEAGKMPPKEEEPEKEGKKKDEK